MEQFFPSNSCSHNKRAKILGRYKACLICHCVRLHQMALQSKGYRVERTGNETREMIQQYRVIESVVSDISGTGSGSLWFQYEENIRAITYATLDLLNVNSEDLEPHLSNVMLQICKKIGCELKEDMLSKLIPICTSTQQLNLSSLKFLWNILKDDVCCSTFITKYGQEIIRLIHSTVDEGTADILKVVLYGILSLSCKHQSGFSWFVVNLEKLFRDSFRLLQDSTCEPLCLELLSFLENIFQHERAVSKVLRMGDGGSILCMTFKKTLLKGLASVQLPLMRILNNLMLTFKNSRQQPDYLGVEVSMPPQSTSSTEDNIFSSIPSIFVAGDLLHFVSQSMETTNTQLFDATVQFLEHLCPVVSNYPCLPVVLDCSLRLCTLSVQTDSTGIVRRLGKLCSSIMKKEKTVSSEIQGQILHFYESLPDSFSSNLDCRLMCSKMFEFVTDSFHTPSVEVKVNTWIKVCQEQSLLASLTSNFLRILLSLLCPLVSNRNKVQWYAKHLSYDKLQLGETQTQLEGINDDPNCFYLQVLLGDAFIPALLNFIECSNSDDEDVSLVEVLMMLLSRFPAENFLNHRKAVDRFSRQHDPASTISSKSISSVLVYDDKRTSVVWSVYFMIRSGFRFMQHNTIFEMWNQQMSEIFGEIVWEHFESFARLHGSEFLNNVLDADKKRNLVVKWKKVFEFLPLCVEDWVSLCGNPLRLNGHVISSCHQEIFLFFYFFQLFSPDDHKLFMIGDTAFHDGFEKFLKNLLAAKEVLHVDEIIFYTKVVLRISTSLSISGKVSKNLSELLAAVSSKAGDTLKWKEIALFTIPSLSYMVSILTPVQIRRQFESWISESPLEFEEFLFHAEANNGEQARMLRQLLMDLIIDSSPTVSSYVTDTISKNDSVVLNVVGMDNDEVFSVLSRLLNSRLGDLPVLPAPAIHFHSHHTSQFLVEPASVVVDRSIDLTPEMKKFTFLIQLFLKTLPSDKIILVNSSFIYGLLKLICVFRSHASFVNVGLQLVCRILSQDQDREKYHITEKFIRNNDFLVLLEHQLSYECKNLDSKSYAYKIVTKMLHDKIYSPPNSLIQCKLASMLPFMQFNLVTTSHLDFLSALLQSDLQSSLVMVEELHSETKLLQSTLLNFEFHILDLIPKACTPDFEAALWRVLCEMLGFLHRHDQKNVSANGGMLDAFLLQPWLENGLNLLVSCRVTDSTVFGPFSHECLSFLRRWSFILAQRSYNSRRFYRVVSYSPEGRTSNTVQICRSLQKLLLPNDNINFVEHERQLAYLVSENAGLLADFLENQSVT